MFQSVLIEMRNRVRAGRMTLTIHAREEMYNDHLTTDDIENGALRGSIIERQWDEIWQEWNTLSPVSLWMDARFRSWQNWDTVTIH